MKMDGTSMHREMGSTWYNRK